MDKLLELFPLFLASQKLTSVSIKNYSSDLRHFLEWLILHLRTQKVVLDENEPRSLTATLSSATINLYRNFLLKNKTAIKTVNRRLSTIRKLCSFAISQGWITTNPATEVHNDLDSSSYYFADKKLLRDFLNFLQREEASQTTINNYSADIVQFLKFLQTTT